MYTGLGQHITDRRASKKFQTFLGKYPERFLWKGWRAKPATKRRFVAYNGLGDLCLYEYDGMGSWLSKVLKKAEKVVKPVTKPLAKMATMAIAAVSSPAKARQITKVQLTSKEWANVKVAKKVGIAVAAVYAAPYIAAGALKAGAAAGKIGTSLLSKWVAPLTLARKSLGLPALSLSRIGEKVGLLKKLNPEKTDAQALDEATQSEQKLQDMAIQISAALNANTPLNEAQQKYVDDNFGGNLDSFLSNGQNAVMSGRGEEIEAAVDNKEATESPIWTNIKNNPMPIAIGMIGLFAATRPKRVKRGRK